MDTAKKHESSKNKLTIFERKGTTHDMLIATYTGREAFVLEIVDDNGDNILAHIQPNVVNIISQSESHKTVN